MATHGPDSEGKSDVHPIGIQINTNNDTENGKACSGYSTDSSNEYDTDLEVESVDKPSSKSGIFLHI